MLIGVAISALVSSVFDQGPYNADNVFAYKMACTFYFAYAVGLAADTLAAFLEATSLSMYVAQLEAQLFVVAASAGGSGLGRPRFERRSTAH